MVFTGLASRILGPRVADLTVCQRLQVCLRFLASCFKPLRLASDGVFLEGERLRVWRIGGGGVSIVFRIQV